ncbi:Hypp9559, partial [Branchiostoma lanceolatum]
MVRVDRVYKDGQSGQVYKDGQSGQGVQGWSEWTGCTRMVRVNRVYKDGQSGQGVQG